jgi:hypothetical protein
MDIAKVRASVAKRAYRSVSGGRNRANRYARSYSGDEMPRNDLTVAEWIAICERFAYRCAYCASPLAGTWSGNRLQMEHIEPIERGGNHSADNVVPSCSGCNASKRQLLLLEWMCVEVKVWRAGQGGRRDTVRLREDEDRRATCRFDMFVRRAA